MTSTVAPRSLRGPALASPRRAHAVRDARLVTYAVGLGALVTIGMWLRHGQLGQASGPGGVATAIGQVTALLGTYAVLVQLLLMSRIAWLERAIGLDQLAVWHRWTGFSALWLLVAHVVFTTIGWAAASIPPTNVAHETAWIVAHEPDVLMAWVGFALFLAVAVTSVRAARCKLKRETWYFVHLYAYLAVALAFAHQLAVGSDFTNDAVARTWWIALYVVVFGAIVWWRVVAPLTVNARHRLRVHSVHTEAPGVVSIWVQGRGLADLDARPGQFFIWRFLTRDGWWQPHPFSLSAAPTNDHLRLTVKNLGDGTAVLQDLRRGTRVFAEGPYGTFTADRRTRRKALLVAGGIGITPLRALLDTFGPHDDVVLLYRVIGADDVVFADELRAFAEQRGMRIYVVTGSEVGDDDTDRLSVHAIARAVPDARSRDCFVCGPPGLIEAVIRRLRKLRVPQAQIHYERFEL
jgi:predicted ferric reductase